MGSSNAIRAGKAEVSLSLNRAGLLKGLNAASANLKNFGASMAGIGAKITASAVAVSAPFLASAKVFADYGSALADASAVTGASVESLAALKFAAEQTGTDFGAVTKHITKLNQNMSGVGKESAAAKAGLQAIGLTFKQLRGLSPEEQLAKISDGLKELQSPADRSKVALTLFGKGAASILPLLAEGTDGLNAFAAEAKRLGLVLDKKGAASADALGDALDKVKDSIKGAAIQTGAALAPALTVVADAITNVIAQSSAWIAANQETVQTVAAVIAGVAAAGVALTAVGGAFIAAGAAISGTVAVFGAIGAAIAALFSPVGILIAALAGAGAAFVKLGGIGLDAFKGLGKTALDAFGGIRDAILNGDIGTAWEIATTGIQLIWQNTLNIILGAWTAVQTKLASILIDGIAALTSAWSEFGASFEQLTNTAVHGSYQAWTEFINGVQVLWNDLTLWITKKLNAIRGLIDSTFDVDAANAKITAEIEQKQATLGDSLTSNINASRVNQTSRAQEIERQRAQKQAQLADAQTGSQNQLAGMAEAAANPLADRIAELQRTLQSQTAKATSLREQNAQLAAKSTDAAEAFKASIPDIEAKVKSDKTSAEGTFNAFAVAGFASGSAQDRTAKATEETARVLKQMNRREPAGIVLA